MTPDAQIVFAILIGTILLFLSEKLALDLVGILALFALYFSGILTPEELLSGFSNPVVVTLAALFVVGGALFRTGVAAGIGEWLARQGSGSQGGLITSIMSLSAVLSAFMSSTGTAAILIPAVTGVAKRSGQSPSKLLMPLAYGCLIGGMLTLVGTAPNLVVQEALIDGGHKPFHFLSFTPMGLVVLFIGIVYMLTLGKKLLPEHQGPENSDDEVSAKELAEDYELQASLFRLQLGPDSPLISQRLAQTSFRKNHHINLVGVQLQGENSLLIEPAKNLTLSSEQILHCHGTEEDIEQFADSQGLIRLASLESYQNVDKDGGVAELLLTPRSRLIGKTLSSSHFQQRFQVNVLSLKRRGKLLDDVGDVRFKFGDALLVAGSHESLAKLWSERGSFVVTGMPEENQVANLRRDKAWIAVALAVLMLVLMTFNLLPSVMAVLLVAAAAVLLGCLNSEEAYHSISWQSLILIAAMLPMALALQKTGGVQVIAQLLTDWLGPYGPKFTMAGLFLLTSLFSQFISNTATTVIMTPIAMEAAAQSGLDPHAFLMAVAVAASSAFVTPVASPVNLLVLTPARYRFTDFVRVGLPLQMIVLVAAVMVLPLLFPLR